MVSTRLRSMLMETEPQTIESQIMELRFAKRVVIFSIILYVAFAWGAFSALYSMYLQDESMGRILKSIWRGAVTGGGLWVAYILLRYLTTTLIVSADGVSKVSGILSRS